MGEARTYAGRAVLADWREGLRSYRFWWWFGILDVRLRYRRTILGPFWITLSFGLSAAALGLVYSILFRFSSGIYIAYLVAGLAVWGLIASLITEGCTTFIRHANLIQQHRLPVLAHALRSVVAVFLGFVHNLLIVVVAVIALRAEVGWAMLLAVPGLCIILTNGLWVAIVLGMLCARFRDAPQAVALLVNLAFFVTPVFWYREMLGPHRYIAEFNPLYIFLELLRAPLLGHIPPAPAITVALAITVLGWLLAFWYSARFQARLAYWM